jgi:hypothetical protein
MAHHILYKKVAFISTDNKFISNSPLNHAMAPSLLKAWFHNYMLAYDQSARSDNKSSSKNKDDANTTFIVRP